jgi:hypothetical protein
MNWINSLKAKSLFTICTRLASTIGSTDSVIQERPDGSVRPTIVPGKKLEHDQLLPVGGLVMKGY